MSVVLRLGMGREFCGTRIGRNKNAKKIQTLIYAELCLSMCMDEDGTEGDDAAAGPDVDSAFWLLLGCVVFCEGAGALSGVVCGGSLIVVLECCRMSSTNDPCDMIVYLAR